MLCGLCLALPDWLVRFLGWCFEFVMLVTLYFSVLACVCFVFECLVMLVGVVFCLRWI